MPQKVWICCHDLWFSIFKKKKTYETPPEKVPFSSLQSRGETLSGMSNQEEKEEDEV